MRLRWRVRRVRPLFHAPLAWARHRRLTTRDIVLDEYPKSGSTWLTFMIADAACGIDLDFENQTSLFPAVGARKIEGARLPTGGRLLRSHEPYRAEYGKAIYLVRHPADVALSYWHNYRWLGVDVAFEAFLPQLLQGRVDGYGSWSAHVTSWLDATEHGAADILIIRYEDLRRSTADTLAASLRFLNIQTSLETIEMAVQRNSIDRMREKQEHARRSVFGDRADAGGFVRTGRTGESLEVLNDRDFALIEHLAGRALRRLGYGTRPTLPIRSISGPD